MLLSRTAWFFHGARRRSLRTPALSERLCLQVV